MNRNTQFILIVFCILKLSIHLLADSHSGFQGDELLHISTGGHLSLGYMEFPPLIGIFAFIQNLFQGQSVFFHHIFSQLASILVMQELRVVYDNLPANEKQNILIWGKKYRQAGAVNLFGVNYNLPKAFSYHGSFHSWAPLV